MILGHRVDDVADLAVYFQTIIVLNTDRLGMEVCGQFRHHISELPPGLLVEIPRFWIDKISAVSLRHPMPRVCLNSGRCSCLLDVLLPRLLAVLVVDLADDLREQLARNFDRESLDLLQDEVGVLEPVDCLKLDVDDVKPMY